MENNKVVQQYIGNPLLIGIDFKTVFFYPNFLDGHKFDLRLYVMIKNVVDLKVFLYKEGIARFASEAYNQPTVKYLKQKKNIQNNFMHLTNYAINK